MKYFELHQNTLYGYSDLVTRPFTVFNSDSESLFQENLQSQSADWIYRTKEIVYERNEFGHRSKSVVDIDSDFILVTGCSYAEGIGLASKDTFASVVATQLGLDYYNLALASSGPDLIYHNLSLWFKNIKKIPKYVIIQQTFPDRAYIAKNEGILPLGPWFPRIPKGLVTEDEKTKFEHLVMSNMCEHYYKIMRDQFTAHMDSLGVKVVEILAGEFKELDVARDLKHPGIASHQEAAVQVLKAIQASSRS